MLRNFFTIISSKYFSYYFLFFSSSGTLNINALNTVPKVSETVFISFYLFIYFILFYLRYFHHSIFQLTYTFFCLSYSAFGSLCCSFNLIYYVTQASLIAQSVKNLPAMQETQVRFLGWEAPLEKEMATHSSILAWKIP